MTAGGGASAGRPAGGDRPPAPVPPASEEGCDWCGSTDTWWRSCKLLCRRCGAIVKSCADL